MDPVAPQLFLELFQLLQVSIDFTIRELGGVSFVYSVDPVDSLSIGYCRPREISK
jgi:hypothetical protein